MREMPRPRFPGGSLLATMLGERAPLDVRRAAQRLRSEGAPALAVDDEIAGLAGGLALSDVSRSLAVLDVLPPLFWIEAHRQDGAEVPGLRGWVVQKRADGLAARGFGVAFGPEAVPEAEGTATLRFGPGEQGEGETRFVRGLITAISLPEILSQMGESSPVLLMPADPPDGEASLLRGFRLSVAMSPGSAPN